MHFPDRRPDQSEERILPLINVVFLLLIFFMIAGSLTVTEPFDIEPPASRSRGEHEPDTLMILMSADERFALNNAAIRREVLLRELTDIMQKAPDTQVTLKADSAMAANDMVRFTQALYEAGVKKLRLLTQPVAE